LTDAELESLCRRHGIELDEGRHVLRRVKEKLQPSSPDGVELRSEHLGTVMEICALFNDLYHNAPYAQGQFWAIGEDVISWIRQKSGLPE
jgi:hypothetical protein